MLHHIQKNIMSTLVENDSVRFADLKPPAIDGNVFTYHLKQLVKDGYIEKMTDGSYTLTPTGKRLGINRHLKQDEITQQAHSIFLIATKNDDGAWLLRKRLVQPARGYIGFVHGEPEYNKPLLESAHNRLLHKTGLQAELEVIAQGYIRIFSGNELESFTHATLLVAHNPHGELLPKDATGENYWQLNPNLLDQMMLPSMPLFMDIVNTGNNSFFDETYTLSS
jgi:ADP-ribose pyrophosphatase YjhB (NUDIX family)